MKRSRQGPDEERAVKLDTTSFGSAVRRLREGLARYEREQSDDQIRDGLIQRFEVTYELSHKMIRRHLKEATVSPDEIEQMPFVDLVRIGNAQGLLRGDWPVWRRYREIRARTSHTYDAGVALEVAAAIPEFLEEAEHLWRTTAARRMTKPLVVDLRADHRRTVLDILHENLPLNTPAWVFGSRATGAPSATPISIWRSTPAGD